MGGEIGAYSRKLPGTVLYGQAAVLTGMELRGRLAGAGAAFVYSHDRTATDHSFLAGNRPEFLPMTGLS